MNKPILCIDFDGVVHSYISGWQGATVIPDPPVKGALEWIWKATQWWDVQIYSSRSKTPDGVAAMREWLAMHALHQFGPEHPMSEGCAVSFCHEKPSAFLTIDDRAVCFHGNWDAIDPQELLSFKPWYRNGSSVS